MAAKSVDQEIVYEEFEPFCKWQRKEDRDFLEIHLQDFKKEQLKVQISNHGVLKISGERPIDASKHMKFYKEVAAPNTKYDTHAIHAKFINNNLLITMPKLKPSSPDPTDVSEPVSAPVAAAPAPEKVTPRLGGNVPAAEVQCQMQSCRKRPFMGSKLAKMAASLAVTALAAVVLAAYVHFMYKSTVGDDSN
ncbi:hypothetical protein SASPL_136144 [Salvia splendens]|uniref:SHSP domain-containing protein n=1 Tax=Salvia splendens TaxID=180675 RepID=A0A8X8X137_SALSN|nr:uncharacterized protein LOC121761272 [Salvia splendens]KAG6403910.1 hypothetical protein SASPL_136144 [Salvia splendens]